MPGVYKITERKASVWQIHFHNQKRIKHSAQITENKPEEKLLNWKKI